MNSTAVSLSELITKGMDAMNQTMEVVDPPQPRAKMAPQSSLAQSRDDLKKLLVSTNRLVERLSFLQESPPSDALALRKQILRSIELFVSELSVRR